jgi:cystathionine gamma-synthase
MNGNALRKILVVNIADERIINQMQKETISIHAGHQVDPATGALSAPIHLSTTFERHPTGDYPLGFQYSRLENPNRDALERKMTALEGGAQAAAFASGSAAALTVFQALRPGDHLLLPNDMYFGICKLIREVFIPWGLEAAFVDMTDLDQVQRGVKENTRLILVETPSNPLLKITDIVAVVEIARQAGAWVLCDNTVATPILQQPLNLGADLALHATTKYLGGHSDVLGGVLVARQESQLWERVRFLQRNGGAVPSPFECWLATRGIDTLPYRVRTQAGNALKIARFLNDHPQVEKVYYPGLPDHPGHQVAARQMTAFGGLLSFQVSGDQSRSMQTAARLRLITRATSFGGTHSLIEHRASIEEPGTTTPENLLRLSIGLEHPDDLIADLDQALT